MPVILVTSMNMAKAAAPLTHQVDEPPSHQQPDNPHKPLKEIIRMPAVFPKSGVTDFAFI